MYGSSRVPAYCTNPGLYSFLLAPPGVYTRDPSSERKNYLGEKWPLIWTKSCDFHTYTFGFFYMPQICATGQMALLPFWRKACWGFFRPEKSDGFGQAWTRELGYQRPARYLQTTKAALIRDTLPTTVLYEMYVAHELPQNCFVKQRSSKLSYVKNKTFTSLWQTVLLVCVSPNTCIPAHLTMKADIWKVKKLPTCEMSTKRFSWY